MPPQPSAATAEDGQSIHADPQAELVRGLPLMPRMKVKDESRTTCIPHPSHPCLARPRLASNGLLSCDPRWITPIQTHNRASAFFASACDLFSFFSLVPLPPTR